MNRPISIIAATALVSLSACSIFDGEEQVPAYVNVQTMNLTTNYTVEGSNAHAIRESWLFVNDQIIGVFEPPFAAPVLEEGNVTVEIMPGIHKNGIVASRVVYPFYTNYLNDTTANLIKGVDHFEIPTFRYKDDITFAWLEDFEDAVNTITNSGNAPLETIRDSEAFEGSGYGRAELNEDLDLMKAYNAAALVLPQLGAEVYLEVNFSCDVECVVGLQVNNQDGSSFEQDMVGLNPTSGTWKKIYIELGEEVSEEVLAENFKVYFRASLPDTLSQAYVSLDNIKLIHE